MTEVTSINLPGLYADFKFVFRQVLGVFEGQEWGHINAHLQDMLGRHALEALDYEKAALHFASTLKIQEGHPNRQQHLLKQFLDTLKKLSPDQVNILSRSIYCTKNLESYTETELSLFITET